MSNRGRAAVPPVKPVWVPSFALARAYLDQRKTALAELATQLTGATDSARDLKRVRLISTAVSDRANAQR